MSKTAQNRRDYLDALNPPKPIPRLPTGEVSLPEAAARLGYTPWSLRRRCPSLPGFFKAGNQWRIREADLIALETGERGVGATAEQPDWAARLELKIDGLRAALRAMGVKVA